MVSILNVLAQMSSEKLNQLQDGTPTLTDTGAYGMTWIIALVLAAGILLITFKTSKRNLERD